MTGLMVTGTEWLRTQLREFVLGKSVVNSADVVFGKNNETFSPELYGDYIATSNGVYTCATLRAQTLSSLPLVLYKLNSGGERKEVKKGNAYTLLQKVNPFWTFNRLIEMTELSLCLWGEAFWFLERGQSTKQPPKEIWWGRPSAVRVVPDVNNYIRGFIYNGNGSQDLFFEPHEVIWFRFPNPLDEYEGLSPIAAARLSADLSSAAMHSNKNIFDNGVQLGGTVMPKQGQSLTQEQADDLALAIEKRFKGVDKRHRWGVFRFEAEIKELGISPKDAEFLGALKWALEDIARAYKVPLDLVGGQRTYENINAAYKALYTFCVLPEARFIASELTEQFLPMFGEADVVEFDSSHVDVLQEAETERWTRDKERIQIGAITINEWREQEGLEMLDWGDVWWAGAGLSPVSSGEPPAAIEPPASTEPMSPQMEMQSIKTPKTRAMEFGGEEHQRLWNRFDERATKKEATFKRSVVGLFKRLQTGVIANLNKDRSRGIDDEPFDMKEWVKRFRQEVRPVYVEILQAVGDEALGDLSLALSFKVTEPAVRKFLEQRTQRFAKDVLDTTWDELKKSLGEGVDAGESIPDLQKRVEAVMGVRIESDSETIARTEVVGAANGGTLLAWKQSDVVGGKAWLAALDERTRDSHREAHEQYNDNPIPLTADFKVGEGRGPAPGQLGVASEDINCRCTMVAVLK